MVLVRGTGSLGTGHAHAGIAAATWQMVSVFVPRLAAALAAHPSYTPVLTGHSMGAGVAALLTMLLHRCLPTSIFSPAIPLHRSACLFMYMHARVCTYICIGLFGTFVCTLRIY